MYKVLVVDDEFAVCQGIRRLIPWNQYGFTVDGFAYNGQQAIESLRRSPFDVVITDIRMPVVDGLTILKTLRDTKSPSKAIILSAYRDFEYARVAIENGACAYLLKPIDGELLVHTLEDIRGELDASDPDERLKCWEASALAGVVEEPEPEKPAPFAPLELNKHTSTNVIKTMIEYMHEHYAKELTLSLMGKMIGMNPVYLGRVFKATAGVGFNEYLNRIRIEKAASMLSDHQNLVYEICDSVGYRDINYFYRMFKSIMGVTPTEYKKRHFR